MGSEMRSDPSYYIITILHYYRNGESGDSPSPFSPPDPSQVVPDGLSETGRQIPRLWVKVPETA